MRFVTNLLLPRPHRVVATALAASLSLMPIANAQSPVAQDRLVEPATAVAAATAGGAPSSAPATIRFRLQAAAVGDTVDQRLAVELALATKITQSGQVAHESTNEMRRQQQRTIEVLEIADGRAAKARVAFALSRRQSPENADPNKLMTQPIEGKSYLMARDGEQLTVTDLAGAIPPMDQFKLVAESLENVGKPNPLATLLVNRRVAVGELIRVPRDMVQPLLGLDDPLGTVHRFELTLARIEPPAADRPTELAVFATTIEVRPNDVSPLTINLAGEMAIEIGSCRLTSVNLSGPVQLSSIERTAGGIFQFSAGGELKLAIRSEYGSVK